MGVLPEADKLVNELIEKIPKLIDDEINEILSGERLGELREKELKSQIIKAVLEKIKPKLDNKEKIKILEEPLKKVLDKKWESIKAKIMEKTETSIIEKELKQEKIIETPSKPASERKIAIPPDVFLLRCAVNKSKKFGLTLQNSSPNNFNEVRTNFELPPEIKTSKKSDVYGNLLMKEGRKRYFQFSPKKEGIYNIKVIVNSDEGYLATIPIQLNVAQEDPGVEELIYKITKQLKPKLYHHTPQVSLKLAEGIESLSGEIKKKKIFKMIIENNSLVDYSLVNIRLTASPQIRVSKIPAYVGDLDRGQSKIRKFGIVPKKEGIFTITAIATSSSGDLTTYPFDIHVGEEPIPQEPEIELIEDQKLKEAKLRIKCPKCSIELKTDDKFCPNCGYVLKEEEKLAGLKKETKICPFCGKKIPIQAKFCAQCGKNLQ